MAIRIITDSSSDFEPAVAKRRNVEIVSMPIQFGKATFLDGKTISGEVFYKLLKEGKENPSTSQPTPNDFLKVFEAAKAAGDAGSGCATLQRPQRHYPECHDRQRYV